MDNVLTVVFIVATVAFFKKQFELSGKSSLIAAFIVALIVGLAPVVALQFPQLEPWITTVGKIIVMFISAAGSVDAVNQLRKV